MQENLRCSSTTAIDYWVSTWTSGETPLAQILRKSKRSKNCHTQPIIVWQDRLQEPSAIKMICYQIWLHSCCQFLKQLSKGQSSGLKNVNRTAKKSRKCFVKCHASTCQTFQSLCIYSPMQQQDNFCPTVYNKNMKNSTNTCLLHGVPTSSRTMNAHFQNQKVKRTLLCIVCSRKHTYLDSRKP